MNYTKEIADRTYSIMEHCDNAYLEGRFGDVDIELLTLDVSKFDTFQCRTWSVCAYWAKDKLENYNWFIDKCHKRVAELKGIEYADRLIRR